jgi:ATP-dependent Lhr-like helicase
MWQGVAKRRHGADALLDAIEQLQGAPLAASILETELLPARIAGYDAGDLDSVIAAGEIVWIGVEPLGERDGRVALYLADHLPRLLAPAEPVRVADSREAAILECLRARGASFFGPLHDAVGGGYPAETVDALWHLAWKGLVTNDTFHALRAFTRVRAPRRRAKRPDASAFRSRRLAPASAEGRWSVVERAPARSASQQPARQAARSATHWAAAVAQQLLARHGVVTREAVMAEAIPGGFGSVYPVLKAMEEKGRLRRGYFVSGLGATQFALPGALDLLRSLRDTPDEAEVVVLAATDPANPYGASLKFPAFAAGTASAGRGPTRTVGATVILVDGALVAYLARGDRQLLVFLPDAEPERSKAGRAIARALLDRAREGGDTPRGMLIEEIDGAPAALHPMAPYLTDAGFRSGAMGFSAARRES